MINTMKLVRELKEAGIVFRGCNSNGIVTDENGNEIQERVDVKAIIDAHDPSPDYRELRAKEYPPLQEQLDMQYWDSVNGTTNWQNLITSIKNKYPKE